MPASVDGPRSPLFSTVSLKGNLTFDKLPGTRLSPRMSEAVPHAPAGDCVCWGIPFSVGRIVVAQDKPVSLKFQPLKARWLVFMHTADFVSPIKDYDSLMSPAGGPGCTGETAADYVFVYADGSEARAAIRRHHQINYFQRRWGDNSFEAVAHRKPHPIKGEANDLMPLGAWGWAQYRVNMPDSHPWTNWLWAWENPHPEKRIVGLRIEPVAGAIVLSAVSTANVAELPLRWGTRRKAILTLPKGAAFDPTLDDTGLLTQVRLDLGQVISAMPRPLYPERDWPASYNNKLPELSSREVLVEYTSHPDALFHLPGGKTVAVSKLESARTAGPLQVVEPATQRVNLRVVEKGSGRCVPVKLHVHGDAGEYLPPVDRHRIPNPFWLQDFGVEFIHVGRHRCAYIPGEATLDLPLGRVYVEVSKGFEIRPVRRIMKVTRATTDLEIEIEKVLPWRERGWVTADTHVHFITPGSAMLEGSAEGVNVVNLLASQWGEMVTNAADFDAQSFLLASEASRGTEVSRDGEHMVRVGTENRQHVLGHISLLGYGGRVIAPMTSGGPDESALGDPVEALLTEWARQCRKQGGLVIIPHFPYPRCEHAATLVSGDADAVEMTSWGKLYDGIDPYSLLDWYRYLNCGYMTAAVAGTDKMSAETAVGCVRTYARIAPGRAFDYDAWMDAVRSADTFATYGPLMEFSVEGRPPGSRIEMPAGGGTLNVAWEAASVTIPMTRVELIVNGEVREGTAVGPGEGAGEWRVKVDRSSWLALLVRGHYADKPEIIAAHSSPVMASVAGTEFFAAADALTILEQIEGAMAYLDTVGTRAEAAALKRMRLVLTSAHRGLHNRMHSMGKYHKHTAAQHH